MTVLAGSPHCLDRHVGIFVILNGGNHDVRHDPDRMRPSTTRWPGAAATSKARTTSRSTLAGPTWRRWKTCCCGCARPAWRCKRSAPSIAATRRWTPISRACSTRSRTGARHRHRARPAGGGSLGRGRQHDVLGGRRPSRPRRVAERARRRAGPGPGRNPARPGGERPRLYQPARAVAARGPGADRRPDVRAPGPHRRLQPVRLRAGHLQRDPALRGRT